MSLDNLDKQLIQKGKLTFKKEGFEKQLVLSDDGLVESYINGVLSDTEPFSKITLIRESKKIIAEGYELLKEENDQEYLYMMLDRLKQDCEYYLGNGNRNADTLWAKNEQGQIDEMKRIWNQLKEKPEWLTWEQILEYGKQMGVEELPSTENGTVEKEINDALDRNYEKEKKTGLEEAEIHTSNSNEVDLEKEKEELQNKLDTATEIQALKQELDDKVNNILDENKQQEAVDYDDREERTKYIKTLYDYLERNELDGVDTGDVEIDMIVYFGLPEDGLVDEYSKFVFNLAKTINVISAQKDYCVVDYYNFVKDNLEVFEELFEPTDNDFLAELVEREIPSLISGNDVESTYKVLNDKLFGGKLVETIDYDEVNNTGFPKSTFASRVLTPEQIRTIQLKDNLTNEQIEWIERETKGNATVEDIEREFHNFGEQYLAEFEDEPIMSLEDYIIELKNEMEEENGR